MNPRINKLLSRLPREKIDGLLVTRAANVSYLAEFSSADSWLLVTSRKTVYITDFRYGEEVKKYLKQISLFDHKKEIYNAVKQLCRSLKIKRLGFEEQGISFGGYRKLRKALGGRVILRPTSDLVEGLRQIKEPGEIQRIRRVVELAGEAFEFLKTIIKPGKREKEVAFDLESFIYHKGAKLSFTPIIASGINSVFPHAKISDKRITRNEAITVDIGVDLEGYKSDLTRVFFLGKIPLFCKQIYKIILEAQRRAINEIRPGQPAKIIDSLARNYIKQKGLGRFFGHSLGHGVGLEVHEAPTISAKSPTMIEKDMVFTVEPGIYIPGKYGVRVEDMVLVKEKGCKVISGLIH